MAGWLDDILSGIAANPIVPAGLLDMLGQPPVRRLGNPTGRELLQQQNFMGPPLPIPGSPGMTIPDVVGPAPQMTPAPPQEPSVPPSPFDAGAPAAPYMFGGGLPPPSAYFPQGARGTDVPASSPTAGAVASAAQPSILGAIGRNILQGLQDNSNSLIAGGGAMISGGLGKGFSALAAAAPLDIAARKEQQANAAIKATYDALIKSGATPAEALAGSQNPAILQTLVAKPTWGQIGTDVMGHPKYGFINPIKQTVTGPQGSTAGAASGVPTDLQGPELLAWLKKNEPVAGAGVEAIIRGDVNAGGRNLQNLLPLAALVDPSLHQFDYATRAKTSQFYKTGPGGLEAKAANTAIEHADQLSKIDAKLGGYDIGGGYINKVTQGAKGLYSSEFQDARREWDAKSETLATEVAKAINGGTPHVADKEHWRAIFAAASTPTERKAAIRSAMEIIQGREGAAQQAYQQGMGSANAGFSFISPENKQRYERLLNYGHEGPAAATPSAPVIPPGTKIGDRKQFKQGWGVWNGQAWVPER